MKLAVIFPGIGYHTDKPLLYFSKKIAKEQGFNVVEVNYGGFETGIKGNKEKMRNAFLSALNQTEEILKDISFSDYEQVLFISKSVGTAVAGAYANNHDLHTHNVYYTPVDYSFEVMNNPGIVFHGNDDPWLDHDIFKDKIKVIGFPYFVIDKGNHSLETGDVETDIENLRYIMKKTKEYISQI